MPAGSRTARSTARATHTWQRRRCSTAGLDGVERGLDPGEPNSANLYTMSPRAARRAAGSSCCPANLLDATRELEKNEPLRAALGKTRDGDYVDYYIEVKRREWQLAHEQITQWELDRYLQLF